MLARALIFFGAALALTGAARAQDEAALWRGKTIRVIVGYDPGGGFDVYARLFAEYFPRFLPGAPASVVTYMPGAATLNAVNHINDVATPDGTSIGIPNSALPLNGYVLRENGGLDAARLNWIGRLDAIDNLGVAWGATGVKNMEDVKRRGIVFAGTQPTGTSVMTPRALNKLIGANIRLVLGYKGTTDQYLAMERGEVEGMANAVWSQLKRSRPEWIFARRIIPLYQESSERAADLADVPALPDLAPDENGRKVLRLLASPAEIGRSFFTGARTPPAQVASLRRAFEAMTRNRDFQAAAEKAGIPVTPLGGAKLQALITELGSYPDSLFEQARELIRP